MNLSKPTVSAAVRRLEQADLVHTAGPREGRRGRKPMSYVVSNRAGFVVGPRHRRRQRPRRGRRHLRGDHLRGQAGDRQGGRSGRRRADDRAGRGRHPQGADRSRRATRAGNLDARAWSTIRPVEVTSLAYNVSPERRVRPGLGDRGAASASRCWSRTTSTSPRWARRGTASRAVSPPSSSCRSAPGWAWESRSTTSSCAAPMARRERSATCRRAATRSTDATGFMGRSRTRSGEAGILASLRRAEWDGNAPTSAREVFELADSR